MIQRATVMKIMKNNIAEVEVKRQGACSHDCSKCSGCTAGRDERVRANAENRIGAAVGDVVIIEGDTKEVMGAITIVYAVPLVLFFVLFAAARLIGYSEGIASLSGCIGFIIGILIAIKYNKHVKSKGMSPFVIIAKG